MRPVCGIENFIEETLASTFRLDYPDYEILFCVADAGDPILPLLREIVSAHPGRDARILVGDDAVSLDEVVRQHPSIAYEPEFTEILNARRIFQFEGPAAE